MFDQELKTASAARLPERPPQVGELVQVRTRRWLVEDVVVSERPGESPIVELACADDDAQGQTLTVFWDYEIDRRILEDEGWEDLASKGFDSPRWFAAFYNTLRWNCSTATDPNLFQAPFRAGITIDAYQMEPLRKALRLPRVNLFIADDTGLGKTIEAALIARELLLHRKVKFIVVATPPSVLEQWKGELEERFGLVFEILDGRIDRKLQPAAEVNCHYFVLPQRVEDRVLEVLVRKTETITKELGSLSKVIDDRVERVLKGGIRHRDADRLRFEIEKADLDDASRQATQEELEAARERQDDLAAQIERCRNLLAASRRWVGFSAAPFRDAISCSLELLGAPPLAEAGHESGNTAWTFPPLDRRASTDPT